MVNKLRMFSWAGGVFLLLLSVWAGSRYSSGTEEPWSFLWGIAAGLLVIALPAALAYAKLWARKADDAWHSRRSSSVERGSVFVSASPVHDPAASLSLIADTVRETDEYDRVRREAFPEGEGLSITHAGFHSSFVRVAGSGRLVVTGASGKTQSLARFIERVCGVSFTNTASNPFHRPRPVRGGSRVFLGLLLVVVVLAGVGSVAGVAYSSSAYNPVEKTVLVSIDLRADVDPRMSETDAKLTRAAFLVDVLSEEAVEISWEQNSSMRILTHSRQALLISEDVRRLLTEVRRSGPTPEQATRTARIETGLHDAERAVVRAICDRLTHGAIRGSTEKLARIRDTIRALAITKRDHDNRCVSEGCCERL